MTASVTAALSSSDTGASGRASGAISWKRCAKTAASDPVRCGAISVPVDWSRPGASERTRIHVARLPASDPGHRIGTLFFNPGGPGEGEIGYLLDAKTRKRYFPAALRERFDIVAVEPRGVGRNTPLHCPLPLDTKVSRFPTDQSKAAALVRSNQRLGADCARKSGAVFGHLDTASVARDMDAVRAALGERQVSFLGVSYGTMLAQSYAELFPRRVRTMVLDGVVDRSLSWRRLAEIDAVAVEDGVGRFAKWCAAHTDCALHGRDVPAFLRALQHRADAGRIVDGARPVRAEEIAQAVNNALNMPPLYSGLASALRKVGETRKFEPLAGFTAAKNPGYPAYRAIICQDVPVRDGAAKAFPDEVRRLRALAPTLRGYSEFWDIASGCAGWPEQSKWRRHAWRVPKGFPPVLLLSGSHDVATPRPFAVRVHRALPGSRLLRWDGDGHTAWGNSPGTVASAVRHLTSGGR
ncbi:alpha/beta fold hydrolase [Streptomyces sp. 8N114]|uniref:alpha/beta fold hydrolase n=1 Tax=Streptomyces sp. 8N114 TaxID=3457419 RepID=UPI003FCF1030